MDENQFEENELNNQKEEDKIRRSVKKWGNRECLPGTPGSGEAEGLAGKTR